MPRVYKRKTNRPYMSWEPDKMRNAIQAVVDGKMSIKTASALYRVSKTTLYSRIKDFRETSDLKTVAEKFATGRRRVFSPELEELLAELIVDMENSLFRLRNVDIRKLAYQFAEEHSCSESFNVATEMAGVDWLFNFLKRYPSVKELPRHSKLKPNVFERPQAEHFMAVLKDTLDEYKFESSQIYTVTETGVTTADNEVSRIVAVKGASQEGLDYADKEALTTVVICASASGEYVPPMLVLPLECMLAEVHQGAPPGSVACCHPSGWIQSDLFMDWFEHFVLYVQCSPQDPVLLLMDGHALHARNIMLMSRARECGVAILSYPAHSSHKFQPLEASFMNDLTSLYESEVDSWLTGQRMDNVTQLEVARVFGNAYQKAATSKNASSGFKKTGIWPFDFDVLDDFEF